MREQSKKNPDISGGRWRIILFIGVVVLLLILIFMPRNAANNTSGPSPAPSFVKQGELTFLANGDTSIVTIDIEIADNASKREIGLMGRPLMGDREGMLFVYEEENMNAFWMKNTFLSLDIIFIDARGGIVTIHKNTAPFSEQTYAPASMTLLVLEVKAGFTDSFGIKVGDRIRWRRM